MEKASETSAIAPLLSTTISDDDEYVLLPPEPAELEDELDEYNSSPGKDEALNISNLHIGHLLIDFKLYN